MLIDLQLEREKRHQAKVQQVYREIKDDVSNYDDAIGLAEALPFELQVRLARYLLTNLITLSDLSAKVE
jgi:hypothetical protein